MTPKLRPAQQAILKYRGGLMAVSAVPGSGKTFTLSVLTAELIRRHLADPEGSVLVVTYLNSAVDNLRQQIAQRLRSHRLPNTGYEVRTLHSLGYEIVRLYPALAGVGEEIDIADERRKAGMLRTATRIWINQHWDRWQTFVAGLDDPNLERQGREMAEAVARSVIRLAKNLRFGPADLRDRLRGLPAEEAERFFLLDLATGIYELYEAQLQTAGLLDFDDLVSRAVTILADYPDVAGRLRQRWPFVLEDEAQDSTPLQEAMLSHIAGPGGNWVRVGDPNQAVMGTFTASDPHYFRRFLERGDVTTQVLPNSGRSARRIIDLANDLVRWAGNEHPVPEVRQRAFRPQEIEPTPEGDPQPNPDDAASRIHIQGYPDFEDELNDVVGRAARYAREHPDDTLAILVPRNSAGYRVAGRLRKSQVPYDELLRTTAAGRGIAQTLAALVRFLADPLRHQNLAALYGALVEGAGGQPRGPRHTRILSLLNSAYQPEQFVYPDPGRTLFDALPPIPGGLDDRERQLLQRMQRVLSEGFKAITLPIDELVMTLAQQRFETAGELAVAHRIAVHLRRLSDANPDWRLPRLADELEAVATGEVSLPGVDEREMGFEPLPGVITLTTLHKAKGLEWDLVYILGITPFDFPGSPDDFFLGYHETLGNPAEEANAQLRALMTGKTDVLTHSPSERAKIELIAERLRLLYVGITRARRYLFLSWSQEDAGRPRGMPIALAALERYWNTWPSPP